MRSFLSWFIALVLVAVALAGPTAIASEHEGEDPDDEPEVEPEDESQDDNPGRRNGTNPGPGNGNGNGHGHNGGNNSTSAGSDDSGPGRSDDAPRSDRAREKLDELYERLLERLEDSEDDRAQGLQGLDDDQRGRVGHLTGHDGNFSGNFVAFSVDRDAGALRNVTYGTTVLISSIHLPISEEGEIEVDVRKNRLELEGEDWELRLTDASSVPIQLRTDNGEPFLVVFPDTTRMTPRESGLQIGYPRADGSFGAAMLLGDVDPSANDTSAYEVSGDGRFHVLAGNAALPQVSNLVRPMLEGAMANRTLGAEVNVLRGQDRAVQDTVLYEDMELDLAEGDVNGTEAAGTYTITVDAEFHQGKTIAVNFQEGLLDPGNLVFRYFNVDQNRTVEAAIAQASDIHDVLDPLNDGTVAEYWVVQDADGVQVLLSIPHFSVHKIQLQSLGTFIVEQPSLVLGVLGSIALVSVATAGLFRRPKDEL